MSCLVSIILVSILVTLSSAGGCEEKKTFGAGHIIDIMLDAKESQALTLKINNGVYDYCRSLDLQNDDLTFEEISCKNNIRPWATFVEYDIDILFGDWGDSNAFQALDDNEQTDILENIDDTELEVFIEGVNNTLILDDIFIHPFYFSYFYSPSMKTLFILTADQNQTIASLSLAFSKINLITISWNPTGSENKIFPSDVNDFRVGEQMDITENNLNKIPAEYLILLDGQKWTTYDSEDMYMVRVNSQVEKCSQPDWLRYTYIEDIYNARDLGFDEGVNGTFNFSYIGKGFRGIDTRIKRAYQFSGHDVSYYEVDDDRFIAWRIKDFYFEHSELSSYWALMWFLVVLFLCCCCCICIYCIKKKKNKKRRDNERFGMTSEQEMMTAV